MRFISKRIKDTDFYISEGIVYKVSKLDNGSTYPKIMEKSKTVKALEFLNERFDYVIIGFTYYSYTGDLYLHTEKIFKHKKFINEGETFLEFEKQFSNLFIGGRYSKNDLFQEECNLFRVEPKWTESMEEKYSHLS